jgi:hypothetical protein
MVFHKLFFDDRRPCLAVCRLLHLGGDSFELAPFAFRRAWGMTAKDAALPDSRVAGVAHALRRRKANAPGSGHQRFEKAGAAASGIRRDRDGDVCKPKRAMSKTLNKNSLASQSRQRHPAGDSDFRWFECSAAESKPAVVRQTLGRREGRLAGQMPQQFAVPVCAHAAGASLSPPDSDGGTE